MDKTIVWAGAGLVALWLYQKSKKDKEDADRRAALARETAYENSPLGFLNGLGGVLQNGEGFANAAGSALKSLTDVVKAFGFANGRSNSTADDRTGADSTFLVPTPSDEVVVA